MPWKKESVNRGNGESERRKGINALRLSFVLIMEGLAS
jgi:hypothetical protein